MKILTLKVGDTVYTSGKITAYHSRRCFALNRSAIELARIGHTLSESDIDKADELLERIGNLHLEKLDLICEVYGNKFTADVLEKSLAMDEIDDQIQQITGGITGIIEKN